MKKLAAIIAGAAFAVTAGAQAERGASLDLGGCTAQLEAQYGRDVEYNIVKKRRDRHGIRVQMAVRLDADNTRFATCWVPGDGIAGLVDNDRNTIVAAAADPPDSDK